MQQIVIVDYGMGNVFSVRKSFEHLRAQVNVSADPEVIQTADKLILPGVGHFAKAMEELQQRNLITVLHEAVLERKIPILGICLGMQLMTNFSEEGNVSGLGWFDAKVMRFDLPQNIELKVPHMGWNTVRTLKESPLTKGISENDEFYFVHSYHAIVSRPEDALHETEYGYPFISAIAKNNIYGVQYHPEKSHDSGRILLKNFLEL